MSDRRRSRRQPSHFAKRQTTLVVPPTNTLTSASYTFYQGNGVNTATDIASAALPTQLVFDTAVVGTPVGAATTGNAATASVSPIFVGTADLKSIAAPTSSEPAPSASSTDAPSTSASSSSKRSNIPIVPIIMALVAACAIAGLLLFLWYRKRSRRRGENHSRVSSEDNRGPPAGDVLRKLGGTTYEKSDPFSDAHAVEPIEDPFADPEKDGAQAQFAHARTGSDSFLSMSAPRAPYTHAVSASTGSSASGKVRKREMEEARQKDMRALNNLVRALDVKERKAEEEGRDRKSLPPVELFKAALVR